MERDLQLKASYGSSHLYTRRTILWIFKCLCSFPQKSHIIHGSFAERDLQLKASYGSSSLYTRHIILTNNALSRRFLSTKEPLIIGLFCGKWPIKMRHPMGLRHPVSPTERLRRELDWMHYYKKHAVIWHSHTHTHTYSSSSNESREWEALRVVDYVDSSMWYVPLWILESSALS